MPIGIYTRTEKCNQAHKGWNHSKESRERMSKSRKKLWADKPQEEKELWIHKMSLVNQGNQYQVGKKWTMERREKRSNELKGDKTHFWKGGITPINRHLRTTSEYKIWRETVFERDAYACVLCGIKSGNGKAVYLQADHIKSFSKYPELRLNIDNGRTLCVDCHRNTDSFPKGLSKNPHFGTHHPKV